MEVVCSSCGELMRGRGKGECCPYCLHYEKGWDSN